MDRPDSIIGASRTFLDALAPPRRTPENRLSQAIQVS
jgi:hypothetical protein